ncbi:DUF6732 family protein [Acuticoccus sediminis]|uniref:DUF6732 family protein n=1 Tax=Acuticoccus sediminis TaxID=2184697 RepID=UPI001390BCEA|nr:DUF6732 family protein [Acuticoccus sediminis]
MRTLTTGLATLLATSAAYAHPGHTALADGHTHAVDPLGAVIAVVAVLAVAVVAVVKFR